MPDKFSVRPIAQADWPEIAGRFRDFTHEQSLTYSLAAASRSGSRVEFLAIGPDAGSPLALASVRIKTIPGLGRGIAWIASGPMVLAEGPPPSLEQLVGILESLRRYITGAGHVMRLRPSVLSPAEMGDAQQTVGFVPTDRAPAYQTVLIDLGQPEETLWKGLHGKWRNPLRNAMKAGIEIEEADFSDGFERFFAMFETVKAGKGFKPGIDPEFYCGLAGPDFSHRVLFARKDGRDVGAMTLGRSGRVAVYLFGATPDAGRRLNAGHFLMWNAALWAQRQGCDWLDLGGISVEDNPSVTRFKQRTGGLEIAAPGPVEARPSKIMSVAILSAERLYARVKHLCRG